jgi:hypothetical protein
MGRFGLALRCFFRVLAGKPVPGEALPAAPEPPRALPPPAVSEEERRAPAVSLLALLQKEGRLVDFLLEEISEYTDAQVGAAVRSIHTGCARVLREQVGVEPVLPGEESSPVTVEKGFDPSRIRLIGNVTGAPPFSGRLLHHGWRAGAATGSGLAAPPPRGHDLTVISPAEVEIP